MSTSHRSLTPWPETVDPSEVAIIDGGLGLRLLDDDCIQDPAPLYAGMHATGMVHPIGDTDCHAVSGCSAIEEVLARPGDFSSNLTATLVRSRDGTVGTFAMDGLGGATHVLATADDPAHATHRKLLIPQLAARRIKALGPLVQDLDESLWRNGFEPQSIEWMSTVANRLPMMIVARLMGFPDDDVDQLVAWGYASTQLLEGLSGPDDLAAASAAVGELAGYAADHLERATASPGDDLLGDLARACRSGVIDTLTAQIMLITLFSAGGESTASLLGSAAHVLATRADVQRAVRTDPGLLGAFLEEVLRVEPPFRGHYRHVVADCVLAGVPLAAGERLLLLWGAANRDPARFDRPDDFRLDRAGGKGHLGFGKGVHFCVGAALARMEATIVIGGLLRRTRWLSAEHVGPWLPSLLVRRLSSLRLIVDVG